MTDKHTPLDATLALRTDALEIFDGPECPQMVRDAIEWYHSSLSVIEYNARSQLATPATTQGEPVAAGTLRYVGDEYCAPTTAQSEPHGTLNPAIEAQASQTVEPATFVEVPFWHKDFDKVEGGKLFKRVEPAPVSTAPAPGYCKNCKDYTIEEPLVQPAAVGAVELTDDEIIALNAGEVFFSESPSKYPEAGHGTQYHAGAPGLIGFAHAVIAALASKGADK